MTITSHIHIGLSAWQSSHSYSIGNRVSSSGNAYQAISAGNSGTTAPSGTGADFYDGAVHWKYLSSAAVTSLSQWESSIPATLTDNYVGLLWNDTPITTTDGVPFLTIGTSGSPRVTGSYTITLTCAPGESYRDKLLGKNVPLAFNTANGVSFTLPASGTGGINYFDIYDSNVVFDGLQFIDPYQTSNSSIINANAGTVFYLKNSIADGFAQPNGASIIGSQSSLQMTNCLVIDRQVAGTTGYAVISGDNNATSLAVNCTFVRINPTNGTESACAFLANNAAVVARNNIVCGYTFPYGGLGNAILVDHNALDQTNVGNATDNGNNKFSVSASSQFQSPTSNFRLKAGAASLSGGLSDTTDIPLSVDIIGYARPQGATWSIGASEFTGQLSGTISLGPIASSGSIGTANNASSLNTIGILSLLASAQQTTTAAGTASLGAITTIASGSLVNSTSATVGLGQIAASGALAQVDSLHATITVLSPFITASIAASVSASAVAGFGPVTAAATAAVTNPLTANATLSPTLAATFGQEVFTAATSTLAISPIAAISASNVLANATLTVSLTPLLSARQEDMASAAVNLTPSALISGYQADLAASASTVLLSVAATARQETQASLLTRLTPIAIATAQQSDTASASVSLGGIALIGGMSPAYLASASVGMGAFTAAVSALQSNTLASTTTVLVSAVVGVTNPLPASAQVTVGPIVSIVAAAPVTPVSATLSLGPISLSATQLLQAGDARGLAILQPTATATATNPYPVTAIALIPAIQASGLFGNTFALAATGLATVSAIKAVSNAKQYDLATASVPLAFSLNGTLVSAPRLRVSQLASEVLASGGNLRVSQTAAEILSSGGNLRVSQTAIEVLTQSAAPSAARVSQIIAEALTIGTPRALVSQSVQEVLTGGAGSQNVRVTQVVAAALTGGTTNQNVRVTQIVLETLISAIPLQITGESFIMV